LLITASPNSTQTTVPLLFMIRYVKWKAQILIICLKTHKPLDHNLQCE
jgi:hypothetical protein